MANKVYITEKFKSELNNLGCGLGEDFITVTRTEGDKVYFEFGRCKLHVTKAELEEAELKADK
jgi:hypothetical protein